MAELPGLTFVGKRADQCSVATCEELGDAWEYAFTAAIPTTRDGETHIEELQVVAHFCAGHEVVFQPALTFRTADWSFSIAVPTEEITDAPE